MSEPDKPLSIQDCDNAQNAIHLYPAQKAVYKQLADIMRENEALKRAIAKTVANEETARKLQEVLQQHKHSSECPHGRSLEITCQECFLDADLSRTKT